LGGSETFDSVHHQEASRDFLLAFATLENNRAIGDRRAPDVFVKQAAERSETLEPDFEADIGHRQSARREQLFRFLNPSLSQILMRSLIECPPEESQKVKAGKTGFTGYLIEIQRLVIALVDELASADQPPISVGVKSRLVSVRLEFFSFHQPPLGLRRQVFATPQSVPRF